MRNEMRCELITGETVKAMWTKLRNCHRDALRRQKKMLKSGAGAETVRQWKFQKQMEFLLPYMENRKRSANIFDSDDEQSDNADTEVSQILETNDFEIPSPILENDYHVVEEDNEVHNNKEREDSVEKDTPSSAGRKFTFKEPQKKKKKNDIGSLIQQSIANREQRAKERSIERQKLVDFQTPNDPLYHFFMSMYQTTHKMPPASQLVIKNKLFEVVSQVESDLLNCQQNNAFPELHSQQIRQNIYSRPQSFSTWSYGENSSTSRGSSVSENVENQDGIVHYINNYTE